MVVERVAAKPEICKPEDRGWPLKGSIVAVAGILYVLLMIV